ncbi:MAG: GntR family transcriptional regulator [Candidatus Atribacteria bacterium]|nr:MAG: GntR family transcriptional regulator [Candidatus Atribacteria bacterium]
MGNEKITSKLKEKIPSYVPIYNKLYTDIINGILADGSQLPSESALTEKYGVSRNTLRQALTVLNEDGLISKSQGKGTVVNYRNDRKSFAGRNIFNPMTQYSKEPIEAIDISFNFGPPTDIAQKKLSINSNEIIMASNVVYFIKGQPIGRAFIQIPVKHIEKIQVNLNNEDEVSNLVNSTIFEVSESVSMSVRVIRTEGEITKFLAIASEEPILYIEELLYNKEGEGIARCKFYFIPDRYDVNIML